MYIWIIFRSLDCYLCLVSTWSNLYSNSDLHSSGIINMNYNKHTHIVHKWFYIKICQPCIGFTSTSRGSGIVELVRLGTELDSLDEITLGCLRSEFSVFNRLRSSYKMYIHTTIYYTCVCSHGMWYNHKVQYSILHLHVLIPHKYYHICTYTNICRYN